MTLPSGLISLGIRLPVPWVRLFLPDGATTANNKTPTKGTIQGKAITFIQAFKVGDSGSKRRKKVKQ